MQRGCFDAQVAGTIPCAELGWDFRFRLFEEDRLARGPVSGEAAVISGFEIRRFQESHIRERWDARGDASTQCAFLPWIRHPPSSASLRL